MTTEKNDLMNQIDKIKEIEYSFNYLNLKSIKALKKRVESFGINTKKSSKTELIFILIRENLIFEYQENMIKSRKIKEGHK